MVYQYVACNDSGGIVRGRIAAESEDAVASMLSYAGYRVISLKPFAPFLSLGRFSVGFSRIRPAEIILLYRQLALLLESGISITTALELLQGQVSNRVLKRVLGEVITDLRNGSQLSAALAKHPKVFSNICCRSLRIGEQTGGLEIMLRQIADYMEKEINARKGVKSALMYPIIASIVAFVVVSVLVGFVLPAFSNLYESLGAQLPALTRFVIDVSEKLRSNGLYILLGMLAAGGAASLYVRTTEGRYQWDRLKLRLPVLGRISHLNELARCCWSISLLFRAGLPLTEIMPLLVQGSSNKVVAQALIGVQQDMLRGEGLSRPMAKNSLFLPMMVQMVKVGEETGNLDNTLLSVAQSYEAEAEDSTRAFIGLIQPAMTILIALFVGVIALSLVSAMYSIYGQTF
jgi:type IV pilus assembly protein PilC